MKQIEKTREELNRLLENIARLQAVTEEIRADVQRLREVDRIELEKQAKRADETSRPR